MSARNSNYISGFDILKFLMALVIISLHTSVAKLFPVPINIYVLNFQNLAVPIFFVISSLLFFQKISHSSNPNMDLWIYEKRLLILYLIWSVIMLPVTLRYHNYLDYGFWGVAFWIKDFFFDYTFLASWFLGALLVGMPIVYCIRNRFWLLGIVSLALYICFHFMDIMPRSIQDGFALYKKYLGAPQRSFLQSVIWLGIGCLLCQIERYKTDSALNNNRLRAIFSWGGVICIVLSMLFKQFQLLGVVAIVLLFYNVLNISCNPSLWKLLRQSSTIIYCVHYPIIHIVWQFVSEERIFIVFIIALIISVITSIIIVKMSQYRPLRFLQYLF